MVYNPILDQPPLAGNEVILTNEPRGKTTAQAIANLAPSGTGDVTGPGSATDGHLAVFNGTTGKIIKDGGAVPSPGTSLSINDGTHTVAAVATLSITGGTVGGTTPNATLTVSGGSSLAGFTTATDTALGTGAGAVDTQTNKNVFVGTDAGNANTSGTANVFVGYKAGEANTTANWNTFVGYEAGKVNVSGTNNVFLGYKAGFANTTGANGTFVGAYAGFSNVASNSCVFVGYHTGYYNVGGTGHTFVGASAGFANTSGNNNVFIGENAGNQNTTGNGNSFVGFQAGNTNITGNVNIIVGYNVQAPTDSTSNYLNIGDVIKGDMTAGPIEVTKDWQIDTGNIILVGATDVHAAAVGTLTNAPVAGDPALFLKIKINGTFYGIPAWALA